MNDQDIIISGMGVSTSLGNNLRDFIDNVYEAKTCYRPHHQIKGTQSIRHVVAYVDNQELYRDIDMRKARKLDRFCLLAMQAFRQSYEQSGLNQETSYDFGILLGNSTGGWSFVEPQLDDIYSRNYENLSPYVATAWFPTAPQGEISIQYKISGYSKTFSAHSLSVGYAIDHAIYLMNNNYLKGTFVGGMESPLSPLVYNACVHAEKVSLTGNYTPFSATADGYLLGEGAGILTIETYGNAKSRNQAAYAKIAGIGIASTLSVSILQCLRNSNLQPEDVDCIFLEGKGAPINDILELNELNIVFASCENIPLTTTKPLYGHLLGADLAVELIVAVQALLHQKIPAGFFSTNQPCSPLFGQFVIDEAVEVPLNNILVYACNLQGASISILLEKI
jgi:3-oxoacyl-(acyl-carrier-protein) synthase